MERQLPVSFIDFSPAFLLGTTVVLPSTVVNPIFAGHDLSIDQRTLWLRRYSCLGTPDSESDRSKKSTVNATNQEGEFKCIYSSLALQA
ncbi:hypothetical protein QO002_004318 [Pararhizobium capsulatum DSM 1112]|uniref:Uncharacterized protein n=1 Tax=Pararhizobium capsulatum DSM 1112 TaxID=1121113 RepID=A0ABU0BVY3_9HYPH|nr:hypothetical protein [Pararhizobium capsulatum]MDQ0322112.1 hypothetical protein [Pararhizobium capsulatum DSM 1112]